jgi:hypothetical protein
MGYYSTPGSIMPDSVMSIASSIDSAVDQSSSRYGQLLNWQNLPDPFWHYGIGLSDSSIFDTGQGLRVFHRKEARQVIGVEGIAYSPDRVIQRLKHAVTVFQDWDYNFLGWNCEHLARLVATGRPRCYQSKPLWMLCNMTPNGDHKIALEVFNSCLNKIDPGLI